jgi:hypothetical protein
LARERVSEYRGRYRLSLLTNTALQHAHDADRAAPTTDRACDIRAPLRPLRSQRWSGRPGLSTPSPDHLPQPRLLGAGRQGRRLALSQNPMRCAVVSCTACCLVPAAAATCQPCHGSVRVYPRQWEHHDRKGVTQLGRGRGVRRGRRAERDLHSRHLAAWPTQLDQIVHGQFGRAAAKRSARGTSVASS